MLFVLLTAASARIVWNAAVAQRESATAVSQLATVQMGISSGDLPSAEMALVNMQRSTRLAAEATSGPLWRAASIVPYAGRNLRTFSGLTRAGDDAARKGLPPLLEAAAGLRPETFLRPDGLDASALVAAREPLARASASLSRARADVDALPSTGLIGPVAEGRSTLTSSLNMALRTLHNTEVAARLAPAMLGAETPRRYLVTLTAGSAQQPGALGAYVLVDFSAGTPSVISVGSGGTIASVQSRSGVRVDGVVRVTPEALAAVLRATGPVVTAEGLSVDAETVGAALSPSSAAAFSDPAARAAFPAQALEASVQALLSNPTAWSMYLLQDLGGQSATGGLQLVSYHADEQELLATTSLSRTPVSR